MPYASLHEAFTPYSENFSEPSETSNPELINHAYSPDVEVSEFFDDSPGPAPSLPKIRKTGSLSVEATQQDPVAAFFGLSSDRSLEVPGNSSVAQTPDDVRTNTIQSNRVGGGTKEPSEKFAPKHFKCGSDAECLTLINHLLSCENCASKLRRLLQVDQPTFGFDLSQQNLSKLMFYFIIALLVIATYELLNKIFKKLIR